MVSGREVRPCAIARARAGRRPREFSTRRAARAADRHSLRPGSASARGRGLGRGARPAMGARSEMRCSRSRGHRNGRLQPATHCPGAADRRSLPRARSTASQSAPNARAVVGSPTALTQPLSIARRSSGTSRTPTSAFSISSGAASWTTRRSRESSSVPRAPSATRMKTGAPNGATPSSRNAPGTRPASTRPPMRCPAARPDKPISACMVRTPSHAARASAYADAKSGAGVPVPARQRHTRCSACREADREEEDRKSELTCSAKSLARRFDLVLDVGARDGVAVTVERLFPGGDRVRDQVAFVEDRQDDPGSPTRWAICRRFPQGSSA